MPLAVGLFIASRIGGGTAAGEKSHYSNLFLTIHVGCVLAAFAGFTLAASLADALPDRGARPATAIRRTSSG